MSTSINFENKTSNLINYRFDQNLKRLITNTTFICTNQDFSKKKEILLNLTKNIINLRAFNFS